jgi:hypothetical protein
MTPIVTPTTNANATLAIAICREAWAASSTRDEDVAAEFVGAEPVRAGRRLQRVRDIDLVDAVRSDPARGERDDDDADENDRADRGDRIAQQQPPRRDPGALIARCLVGEAHVRHESRILGSTTA